VYIEKKFKENKSFLVLLLDSITHKQKKIIYNKKIIGRNWGVNGIQSISAFIFMFVITISNTGQLQMHIQGKEKPLNLPLSVFGNPSRKLATSVANWFGQSQISRSQKNLSSYGQLSYSTITTSSRDSARLLCFDTSNSTESSLHGICFPGSIISCG